MNRDHENLTWALFLIFGIPILSFILGLFTGYEIGCDAHIHKKQEELRIEETARMKATDAMLFYELAHPVGGVEDGHRQPDNGRSR